MKEKIFQLLKTKFSNLGLGDKMLETHAETLDGLGLITDDNIEQIIAGQEKTLKAFQRVADQERSAKKQAEENAKALSELKAKMKQIGGEEGGDDSADPSNQPTNGGVLTAESIAALIKKELATQIKPLQDELEQRRAAETKQQRAEKITNKAKELGIPEWRIKEGFVISPEADDEAIATTLTEVKQNIVTAGLEKKSGFAIASPQNIIDEEARAFVETLPEK